MWHAFSYLPEKEYDNISENTEILTPADETREYNNQESEDISDEREDVTDDNSQLSDYEIELQELKKKAAENRIIQEPSVLEPIDEENADAATSLENALSAARDYKLNHKPISAISEYKKAASMTDSKEIKAECYENIAIIFASGKRRRSSFIIPFPVTWLGKHAKG